MVSIGRVGGGISEGDYNMWTHKWSWSLPNGILDSARICFHMDEKNDIFYLWWYANSPAKIRFGTYNITDHSAIFESPTGSNYTTYAPYIYDPGKLNFELGCNHLPFNILRSHQSYILLSRYVQNSIEVWKAGSLLWTHDLNIEGGGSDAEPCAAEISLTGKYILIYECYDLNKLMLYEGG